MIHHQKLREIVDEHLGKLITLTIDVKSQDRIKLTFMYEDEYLVIYEYKMIINLKNDDIEFIKNKSRSLRRGLVSSSVKEFEKDILENMKYEF
ncbi:hypothetical protein RJG79_01030 [Mycoplasmatota bacterium WC44]